MKKINHELLKTVSEKAISTPRLRMNYNFHKSYDEGLQRMLNALEPDTFLPPHRHKNPDKSEIFMVLKGSVLIVEFTSNGDISDSYILDPQKGHYGVEIEPQVWHTVFSLESGTVIYEIKEGPFSPISMDNIAPWADWNSPLNQKAWKTKIFNDLKIQS